MAKKGIFFNKLFGFIKGDLLMLFGFNFPLLLEMSNQLDGFVWNQAKSRANIIK